VNSLRTLLAFTDPRLSLNSSRLSAMLLSALALALAAQVAAQVIRRDRATHRGAQSPVRS